MTTITFELLKMGCGCGDQSPAMGKFIHRIHRWGTKKSPQSLASLGAWLFLFYLCQDNPLPDPLVEGPKVKAKAKAESLHTWIMVGEWPLGKMAAKENRILR